MVIDQNRYAALMETPCHALSSVTLSRLSSGLNVEHTLPGRNGHCRDWRVLAELVLPHERVQQLRSTQDPLAETLKAWPVEATVEQIIRALEAVERFDVIEDSLDSIIEDCEDFERRKAQWGIPSVIHSTNFDAFVIHSPNDTEFVKTMIDQVESVGVRLFVPARDFPAAMVNFQFRLMQIMEQQCKKIIIVISRELMSDDNAMMLVGRAEEIRAFERPNGFRSSRILPLILEDCPTIGTSLISISPVNFRSRPDWAWRKLREALTSSSDEFRGNNA